jgi:hypothetical protein
LLPEARGTAALAPAAIFIFPNPWDVALNFFNTYHQQPSLPAESLLLLELLDSMLFAPAFLISTTGLRFELGIPTLIPCQNTQTFNSSP